MTARQSLSQLVLPGDPDAALKTATKAYVDAATPPALNSGGGLGDFLAYGDALSSVPRAQASATFAFSATNRTLLVLLGWGEPGSIAGFRFYITTAAVGGVMSAALFTAASLAATSWARLDSNQAPVISATGLISVTDATSLAAAGFVILQMTLTTAPTTYPVIAATPAGQANLINPSSGAVVAGTSSGTTAPGATLNPTTGFTKTAQRPWASLY